jgi:hypothetical protein
MGEIPAGEAQRRRRDFIRVQHPDRGGDPESFIAGLRAFGTGPGQDSGPLPRVVIVRRRAWPARLMAALAGRHRNGSRPPRVR